MAAPVARIVMRAKNNDTHATKPGHPPPTTFTSFSSSRLVLASGDGRSRPPHRCCAAREAADELGPLPVSMPIDRADRRCKDAPTREDSNCWWWV
jgi:hypothetical protein